MRRRAVRLLGEKRDRMLASIEEHFEQEVEVQVQGAASGTHLFLRLPDVAPAKTSTLIERAARNGVRAYDASRYYECPPSHAVLILGYTTVDVADIDAGVKRLAAAAR